MVPGWQEVHEDFSIPRINFYRAAHTMTAECDAPEFTLADWAKPEPARLRRSLSVIVNFMKFFTDKNETLGEVTAAKVRPLLPPLAVPRTQHHLVHCGRDMDAIPLYVVIINKWWAVLTCAWARGWCCVPQEEREARHAQMLNHLTELGKQRDEER